MNLPPIELDPRFSRGVDLFNSRDYFEAGELFEELFFDAAGDEIEFARAFLQASVGFVHVERKQIRAAISRLEEAVRAIDRVHLDRGFDLEGLRRDIETAIAALARNSEVEQPQIGRR